MIGYKTLAVPGPTNMPYEVQRAMEVPLEDHRAPDFPNFTLPLFADLKTIFRTETGRVFVFPGSGTGGWEAAISNLLSAGDKVLTSSFGQFSTLWVNMCRDFGLDVHNFDVTWGEGVPLEDYHSALSNDKAHAIKAVLVCHNETATGVTSDVKAVRQILDDLGHPALLFVDGVSSVGSLDFRMEEWGVDVAVSGSQKGFMMPTGLVIVALSERVVNIIKGGKWQSKMKYYDFGTMISSNETGYFPYTPAMTLMRGLRTGTDILLEEGMENVWARHRRLANGVRAAVDAWGMELAAKDPATVSDTVSSIKVDRQTDANDVILHAYNEYGISLGAGLGPLNGNVFRIGHLGWLNETMVLGVIGGVELTLRDLGVPFKPGSGVGAAIESYTSADPKIVQLILS